MRQTFVWAGDPGTSRVEIAHVEVAAARIRASGTQVGIEDEPYELRYELDEPRLRVELVGHPALDLVLLDGTEHFDLGYSPLFNSLPVLRDALHRGGEAREYVMTFVSVPDLVVTESRQRYDPLSGEGLVRYSSGAFTADIEFDDDGLVIDYPGLASRVFPPAEDVD